MKSALQNCMQLKFVLRAMQKMVLLAGLFGSTSLLALYQVVDLGAVKPDTISLGIAVNDEGHAAAVSIEDVDGSHQAFVSRGNGQITPLTEWDVTFSTPKGINREGFVVGRARVCNGPISAFAWNPEQTFRILPSPYGTFTSAAAINERNEIAGTANISPCSRHAVVWYPESDWVDLGTLGGQFSNSSAINNEGAVAGRSGREDGESHAFIWTKEKGMQDLGTLGGPLSGARGINDKGWVVGYAADECRRIHAFLWRGKGAMESLDHQQVQYSIANDVNNQGQVVGVFRDDSFHKAFVWTEQLGLTDLHTLISCEAAKDWRLHSAKGINNRGEIVGIGQLDGHYRGFLLLPSGQNSSTKAASSTDSCTIEHSECEKAASCSSRSSKEECDSCLRCGASEQQCVHHKQPACQCGQSKN